MEYHLEIGSVTYLASVRSELLAFVKADGVAEVAQEGGLDFTTLNAVALEVLYEVGEWSMGRRGTPGVQRLLGMVRGGDVPYLIIWRRESDGVSYPSGIELGGERLNFMFKEAFDVMCWGVALGPTIRRRLKFEYAGYFLVNSLWNESRRRGADFRDRLPASFSELVRSCYVPWVTGMFGDNNLNGLVQGYVSECLLVDLPGVSAPPCIVTSHDDGEEGFLKVSALLEGRGFRVRRGGRRVRRPTPDHMHQLIQQWEWITGSDTPLLALIPDGETFRSTSPDDSTIDLYSGVFVLCDWDAGNEVFCRIREVFGGASAGRAMTPVGDP